MLLTFQIVRIIPEQMSSHTFHVLKQSVWIQSMNMFGSVLFHDVQLTYSNRSIADQRRHWERCSSDIYERANESRVTLFLHAQVIYSDFYRCENDAFLMTNCDVFSYFYPKHDLWVLVPLNGYYGY